MGEDNYDSLNSFFDDVKAGGTPIANIFSRFPLINSNAKDVNSNITSYRGDGVNPTEILNYMFKKQFGIPNSSPYSTYATEPAYQSSFQNSTKDRQFSQEIPFDAPTDIYEDSNFRTNIATNPNININIVDNNQARYISSERPYLAFYSNIIMAPVTTGSKLSFWAVDPDFNILTQNAINLTYSAKNTNIFNSVTTPYSSKLELFTITGSNISYTSSGNGNWLLDCDSGILTLYDDVDSNAFGVVDANSNLPRISFWRYEGLIGNNTVMNVREF